MATQIFDSKKASLSGTRMIEASAGTGKTYSIAILVLRLLIEEKLPINKILMVTFTNAAVAELEARIRRFVRLAFRFSSKGTTVDSVIEQIIFEQEQKTSKQEVQALLRAAVADLDETSIFTIHGFCDKVLTEFAFETNQVFDSEMLKEQTAIVESGVNQFWRKKVSVLPIDQLKRMQAASFSRANITKLVEEAMMGKTFVCLTEADLIELEKKVQEAEDDFHAHIDSNFTQLRAAIDALSRVQGPIKTADNAALFGRIVLEAVLARKKLKWMTGLTEEVLNLASRYANLQKEYDRLNDPIQIELAELYNEAITFIVEKVAAFKTQNNFLSFDDLITNLHTAVKCGDVHLKEGLKEKYEAVFIDEFQDTDKLQYEIFSTLFDGTKIYYIGDPKQSIYGWRKADLETYKLAKSTVDPIYSMDKNYRSTVNLIAAMNHFFCPVAEFDVFHDPGIKYVPVGAGATIPEMEYDTEPVVPISIIDTDSKPAIQDFVVSEVVALLTDKQFLIRESKNNKRRIRPSDIGILVRKNIEGKAIKQALANAGIPAVTIDDSKVLESEESIYVYYIMLAVCNPSRASINRALLCPLTGFSIKDLEGLNEEVHLAYFRELKSKWEKDGIYTMLLSFIKLYRVKQIVLNQADKEGERCITNLLQICELLHKTEIDRKPSMEELAGWLIRMHNGAEVEGDEFQQRIESDEDAVNIVTIHRCKGLSYNIVFAPHLDMNPAFNTRHSVISYRSDSGEGYMFSIQITNEQKELYKLQNDQENMRLIYVAITRSVYKCYISNNLSSYFKSSSLKPIIDANLEHNNQEHLVEFNPENEYHPDPRGWQGQTAYSYSCRSTEGLTEMDRSWSIHSFSGLSDIHSSPLKKDAKGAEPYDDFVFTDVPRGAAVGTFLHTVFEQLDFSCPNNWENNLAGTARRYSNYINEKNKSNYLELIRQVMNATIRTEEQEFCLSQIDDTLKLAEIQFYFSLDAFDTNRLASHSDLITPIDYKQVQGLMTGFIDLFFEYQGKYYILDWKSNHLGDHLDCYDDTGMNDSMLANNYHLQYLIYTVAVIRYLKSKIPNFDYNTQFGGAIYVFLRGARIGQETGIFFRKPKLEDIKKLENMFLGNTVEK